jgi:hypothetical protein
MKMFFSLLSLASLSIVGCGGGGGDDEDSSLNTPSEQVLCSLTIGQSNREDVLRALGPAASTTAVAEFSMLDYQYGDFETATSLSEVAGLNIVLDEDGLFDDATVINIPFPKCWSDEIEARKRELSGG